MSWETRFYRYYSGIEFSNVNTIPFTSKQRAREFQKAEKEHFSRTALGLAEKLRKFPHRTRIVKTKGGYFVMGNNTVHNMNAFERTGKIPKKRKQ